MTTSTITKAAPVAPQSARALGLRRLVKDGHLSAREALDLLARKRKEGQYVTAEIIGWLQRKLQS